MFLFYNRFWPNKATTVQLCRKKANFFEKLTQNFLFRGDETKYISILTTQTRLKIIFLIKYIILHIFIKYVF